MSKYPWLFWYEAALASQAAAVTIAVRTRRLQAAALKGALFEEPEFARMFAEKYDAAISGGMGGMTALMRAGAKGPRALAHSGPAVFAAATRPGFQKAHANARRLTRRRKTR